MWEWKRRRQSLHLPGKWGKQPGERCSGIADKGGFPMVCHFFVLSWTAQSGLHFYSAQLKARISQWLPAKKKHDILGAAHNALVANAVSQYFFHGGQLLCLYKSNMTWSSAVTGPYQALTGARANTFQPKNRKAQRIRTSPHHPALYSILLLCHMKIVMKIYFVLI